MESYETLLYGTFDLDEFSDEERAIYEEVKAFAEKDPELWDLKALWTKRIKETGILKKRTGYRFAYQKPLAKIYSDIELRLYLKNQEKREKEQRDAKEK